MVLEEIDLEGLICGFVPSNFFFFPIWAARGILTIKPT